MPLDRIQDAPKSPSDAPRQTRRRTPDRTRPDRHSSGTDAYAQMAIEWRLLKLRN